MEHSQRTSVQLAAVEASHAIASTEAPVWFITGCASGLGLALANQAIARGFRTVITACHPAELQYLEVGNKVLVLRLDVSQPFCIAAAVAAAERRFGQIDVLVNNASVGYFAAIEEGEIAAVRKMFEVNVFGLCQMVQAVLPGMRKRRSGCVVNISSLPGLRSHPALGYYNASKFAVQGLTEALWQEVKPSGLQVMLVEPSRLRTDWAAQAILDAVASGHPPHHLLLPSRQSPQAAA